MGKRSDKSPKRKGKKTQKVVVKHPKRVAYGATWRIPTEKKNIDFDTNLVVPNATFTWGTRVLLNGVDQGPGATQYVGRQLMLKKMMFRFVLQCRYSGASVSVPPMLRLMIIYDKSVERNAAGVIAPPLPTDILVNDDFGSFNNLGNSDRFCVLYDKIKPLGITDDVASTTASNFNMYPAMFKANIKLNHIMKFVGTTNLIASIEKGAIYAMCCQSGGLLATANVDSKFYTRFRFVDS